MRFNFLSILFCFTITFVQGLYGQTCDCTFCFDTTTVSAGGTWQTHNSYPCAEGTAAAVSEINVQSTDQSGFQIYTKDDPSSSEYYTAGSTTTTVTCFKMGDGFVVGGRKPQIYVIIECKNWFQPCPVRYTIDLVCEPVGTTSTSTSTTSTTITRTSTSTSSATVTSTSTSTSSATITPTFTSTAIPVNISTVTAITFNNSCECACCKGSATCNPVYVGTIFYGSSKCEESNCASQCVTHFSSCPVKGFESGKVLTHCRNNTGTMLKSSFYILLLVIISIYI